MVGALFVLIFSGPGDLTNVLVELLRSPRTNTPLRLYLVNLLLEYFQGSQRRQQGQSRGRRICRLCGSADVVEHGQLLSTLCVNMAFAVIATHYRRQALSFLKFNILFGIFGSYAQKQVSGWRAKAMETSARSLYIFTGNSKRCKRRTCEAPKDQECQQKKGNGLRIVCQKRIAYK